MRYVRDFFRKLNYKIKFFGKKKEMDNFYISNSKINNQLKELMNHYGSDKGGITNHHNFANYYSEIFDNKKDKIKNFLEIGLGTNNENLARTKGWCTEYTHAVRAAYQRWWLSFKDGRRIEKGL